MPSTCNFFFEKFTNFRILNEYKVSLFFYFEVNNEASKAL